MPISRFASFALAALVPAALTAAQAPVLTFAPQDDRADTGGAQGVIDRATGAKPWTVQIEPAVWWVAPSGKARLPGNSTAGNGDRVKMERLNLDSPRASPYGEVHVNADRWRFSFSGASFSEDQNTTADSSFQIGAIPAASGDALRTALDFTTLELTAGYRVWEHDFAAASKNPAEATESLLGLILLGGARIYDVDMKVDVLSGTTPGTASHDDTFIEPIIGARLEFRLARAFTIDLQVSGGGWENTSSIDVAAGFMWFPIENVGVQIGWRQVAFDLSEGEGPTEFEYDGRLAGLFGGVTIRF